MDPLSFAAGIIAVLNLAGSVGGALKKLHSLQHASDEFLALFNEISDFQAVLSNVVDVCDVDSLECKEKFKPHVDQASAKLASLQAIIKPRTDGDFRSVIVRLRWLKVGRQVAITKEELKHINLNILTTLGVVTHSTLQKVRLVLEEVQHGQRGYENRMTELIQGLRETSSPASDLGESSTPGSQIPQSITQTPIHTQQNMTTCFPNPMANEAPENTSGILRLSTSYRAIAKCQLWCSCACHKRHRFRTPQLFAGLTGSLFVGYVGRLVQGTKCDELQCEGRSRTTTKITYYFPTWFLVAMISCATGGPRMSLTVSRVVSNDSPIFSYASAGNVDRMRDLFERRLASPFDVSPTGFPVLHVCGSFYDFPITTY